MEQGQTELHVPYLPIEIMLKIGHHISTWLDVQRFRASLKIIKDNLPPPPHQRLKMMIPYFVGNARMSFTKCDVFNCLNGGWVVQVDYNVYNVDGKSPGFMHPLRDDDFFIDEVDDHPQIFNPVHSDTIELPGSYKLDLYKVAFHSQSIWKVLEDFQILAVRRSDLALFKSIENAWSFFDIPAADIICYKGKFYAVQDNGHTIMLHLDLTTKEVARPLGGETGDRKYLIESEGDLLLVDRYYVHPNDEEEEEEEDEDLLRTYKFTVFKLNEVGNRWVRVFTLGDCVLFVGFNNHFSVAAPNVAGARADLIFFSEPFTLDTGEQEEEVSEHSHGAYDVAFFDMTTNNITQLIYANEFAACFWPPPPWTRDEVV